MNVRQALEIEILMNTRGLMQLIVLNIGLDIHVISPELFSMMVVMALTITVMTGPLRIWVYRGKGVPEAQGNISAALTGHPERISKIYSTPIVAGRFRALSLRPPQPQHSPKERVDRTRSSATGPPALQLSEAGRALPA